MPSAKIDLLVRLKLSREHRVVRYRENDL